MTHRSGRTAFLLVVALLAAAVAAPAEARTTHAPPLFPIDSAIAGPPRDAITAPRGAPILESTTMSTSASGNAQQVREQLDKYQSQFGGSGPYHQAAAAARAAVDKLMEGKPDSTSYSISITETVSGDSAAYVAISFSATQLAQAAGSQANSAGSAAGVGSGSGAVGAVGSASQPAGSPSGVQQPSGVGTGATPEGGSAGSGTSGS